MAPPKGLLNGNKFAVGNRGGGRKGYEYEQDQLIKMRKILDRALAGIEAFQRNKLDKKGVEKLEKVLEMASKLKITDKLHANKQEMEHKGQIFLTPTPIYGGQSVIDISLSKYDGDQKDLPAHEENQSS